MNPASMTSTNPLAHQKVRRLTTIAGKEVDYGPMAFSKYPLSSGYLYCPRNNNRVPESR